MSRLVSMGGFLALATALLYASPAIGTPVASFTPLDDLPGGLFSSHAVAVNNQGTVVGYGTSTLSTSFFREAFRWNADTGLSALGDLPGGRFHSDAAAISDDGSVIVGRGSTDSGNRAVKWTVAGGIEMIPESASGLTPLFATAVSANGAVIVGLGISLGQQRAFKWSAATGTVDLGLLPGTTSAAANAVSADGSTIFGGASGPGGNNLAFKWNESTGIQALGLSSANIADASSDGQYLAATIAPVAVRWSASGGVEMLGDLPGGDVFSRPTGMSANGATVVGYSSGSGAFAAEAFIWQAVYGMRPLQDVLIDYGVDTTGWNLAEADGISPDGRNIVGFGINPSGFTEAWLVILPVPSPSTLSLLALGLVIAGASLNWRRCRNGLGAQTMIA